MKINHFKLAKHLLAFSSAYQMISNITLRLVTDVQFTANWHSSENVEKLCIELRQEIEQIEDLGLFYQHFSDVIAISSSMNSVSDMYADVIRLLTTEEGIKQLQETVSYPVNPNFYKVLSRLVTHWYKTAILTPAICYPSLKYEYSLMRSTLILNTVIELIFYKYTKKKKKTSILDSFLENFVYA